MTVEELAKELAKVKGEDRKKDVISQSLDNVTFDTVVGAQINEDNYALFVSRYQATRFVAPASNEPLSPAKGE